MADGTTLNNIFVPRIHRSNARDVVDDSERTLQYYRDRLLILAAMSPAQIIEDGEPVPWDFYVRREIDAILDELERDLWRRFCAQYIIDCPDDVSDDYDPDPAA
jgi:hypothetical protein